MKNRRWQNVFKKVNAKPNKDNQIQRSTKKAEVYTPAFLLYKISFNY